MKRVILAVLALVAAPAMASAQVSFGAAAGAAFPTGDLGKSFDSGYHAQVSLGIAIPLAPIGFRIDGTLDHFDTKNTTITGSDRILGVAANVEMGFGAVPLLGPYVIAGAGLYNSNVSVGSVSDSKTKPGASVGAGIRFGLGGLGVYAETRYHYVSTDGSSTQFVPVMFGVSF